MIRNTYMLSSRIALNVLCEFDRSSIVLPNVDIRRRKHMLCWSTLDNAIYSDSIVDNATIDWRWDFESVDKHVGYDGIYFVLVSSIMGVETWEGVVPFVSTSSTLFQCMSTVPLNIAVDALSVHRSHSSLGHESS